MHASPRLVLTLLALVSTATVLAPNADAQRQDTVPTYTVTLGGVDVLFAGSALISGVAPTRRSNLSRATSITLTGLTLPGGGAKGGGDCGFEEGETCNGKITFWSTDTPSVLSCLRLYEVVITPPDAAAVPSEEVTIVYESMNFAPGCNQEDD